MISRYKLKKIITPKRDSKYIFVGHHLDLTGAPYVMFDIIQEFVTNFGPEKIEVWGMSIAPENLSLLNGLKVKYVHYSNLASDDWLDVNINVNKNDFVFLNSTGVGWNVRDRFLYYTANGKLAHLHWYTHEGDPEMYSKNDELTEKIKDLLSKSKLSLYVPSAKVKEVYEKYYKNEVTLAPYRFTLDTRYHIERIEKDFDAITFVVNGTAGDGRKGQPAILSAFAYFYDNHYLKSKKKYRDFKLKLIGLGDDYLSEQLKFMGSQLLPGRFSYTDRLPRKKVLDEMLSAQANVTYSFSEALPMNIFESMYMGQFLLRNDCAGREEQLIVGKSGNGWLLPDKDIKGFAKVLDEVLDKKETTNKELLEKGRKSQEIVKKYSEVNYFEYFTAQTSLPVA